MKTLSVVKAALGGGAAILAAGLLAAPAAHASTGVTVPCKTPALIAAISTANSSGGARINLAPGCTYHLTAANNTDPMLGATGLPVITSRITLNGFHTTIAGNNSSFRIFLVTAPGNLTLNRLTITGGNVAAPGGGIFNVEGTLTLNHSTVTGNASGGMMAAGGGIASGTFGTGPIGTTTLNFSQVNGNTANGGPMAGAGGIANGGTAAIKGSVVAGNTAPGAAGGGILNHGVMTITLSKVTGNTAPADSAGDQGIGGGIANINLGPVAPGAVNGGILAITTSQIRGNTASGQGGGIFEATITPNGPAPGGPLTLTLSQVTGNTAGQGGGIFAVPGSPITLKLTLIARNTPDNCAPPGSVTGCKN